MRRQKPGAACNLFKAHLEKGEQKGFLRKTNPFPSKVALNFTAVNPALTAPSANILTPASLVQEGSIQHENALNLSRTEIITPIKVEALDKLLIGYDPVEHRDLINGFRQGFRIGYAGPIISNRPPNLQSAIDNPEIVEEKIQNEVALRRVAGPFDHPPFRIFHASPVGFIEKKSGGQRFIQHLSFPRSGDSVNSGIPSAAKSVSYASFDEAVTMMIDADGNCVLVKTDIQEAFRLLPVHPDDRHLLGFIFKSKFYFDKCLAFGLASSCKIFERFSAAIQWIAMQRLAIPRVTHLLDDFLFALKSLAAGEAALSAFRKMANLIGLPLSEKKTVGPATSLPFLGIQLDSVEMSASLPADKLASTMTAIENMLSSEKTTLHELQSLIGLLNFVTSVVVPGRPFTRRLIDLTIGLKKPRHRRRVTSSVKADLLVWLHFLSDHNGKSLFLDERLRSCASAELVTDSSQSIGFGAILGTKWTQGTWEPRFRSKNICVLEFYPIVLGVHLWYNELKDSVVNFKTDNMALVSVINRQTSKHPELLGLLRLLVLLCLKHNILFRAEHIPGYLNGRADNLSRFQMNAFWSASNGLQLGMDESPTPVPPELHHRNWFR